MKEGRTNMVCRLARRMISRAEDCGTKPPRWVGRHAARCGACLEYARFTDSLKTRLAAEKPGVLDAAPEFPLDQAAWAQAGTGREKRASLVRRLTLHPFPAAAAALLVVAAGLVLFQVALREPSPPSAEDRAAVRAALRSFAAAPDEFPGVVTEAESSLMREREILKRSLASAAEYLQARLNIKIERRDAPRSF
jgi:hypothetical protein